MKQINNEEYSQMLSQALEHIRAARIIVAKQVNSTRQSVYWSLGKLLFEKQLEEGYGSGIVKQLSIALKSEFAGKMNLYLSLLDKLEKGDDENQSVGIILCAEKDHLDVEIALQDINKPIGVAEYQLLLPLDELQRLVVNEINATTKDNFG
jgi:hypothetical protein